MSDFQHVTLPEGDLVTIKDGQPAVGNRPIIGSLRGDGIGLDITPAMKQVVKAAVDRAFGGKREIQWCPIYVGLEGLQKYGEVLPQEAVAAIQHLKIAIKGPSACGRCPREAQLVRKPPPEGEYGRGRQRGVLALPVPEIGGLLSIRRYGGLP